MAEFNIDTNSNFTVPTHQQYSDVDLSLISNIDINSNFNPSMDYIEYFIYDLNNNIIISEYNYQEYNTTPTSPLLLENTSSGLNVLNNITVDPESEFSFNDFYSPGSYIINYNFYEKLGDSSPENTFYISEISPDRTEIRILNSRATTNFKVEENVNSILSRFNAKSFPDAPTQLGEGVVNPTPAFDDFYLNFGDNTILIATNIALDKTTTDYSVLIKLYEPLSPNFNIKDQLWLVDKKADSVSFNVEVIPDNFEDIDTSVKIQGPNFNLDLKDGINNSTNLENYNSLINTDLTSSYQQYKSILGENGIDINVDYTEYSNYTHFSSAKTRLDNFYYKVKQIEDYRSDLSTLESIPTNTRVSSSANVIEKYIDDIIENFDGYEYFLYFDSGSKSWPKTNSEKPYILALTSSAAVQSWYSEQTTSASLFDENNPNNLYYAIPEYLRNDPANECYELFISMTGQLYDNIWIYYKDVTEKYDADNRLDHGISPDLISEAIRDFGLKIYQNNFSNSDLFSAFLGINPNGGLQPPTGSELITSYISSSEEMIPQDSLNKSFYKRIYHNLPYLLKTKGTIESIKTLARIYGIPETILKISEFGGKDKDNTDDWDYWFEEFNYKFDTKDTGFITSSWNINYEFIGGYDYATYDSDLYDAQTSITGSAGRTLQFRFKTPGLDSAIEVRSQSLWTLDTDCHIILEYTGSGFDSGSYSGSIPHPYNEYAVLKFLPDYSANPEHSASILLPFYDGGWWSVMATMKNNTASLFAGNKIYSGSDGARLGFYGSDSIIGVSENEWLSGTTSSFASASIHEKFSGSLQEIKYYYPAISESVFYDYIMNPQSIEGNGINGGAAQLAFRGALGGDLYTGSESIHPKAAGPWTHTASFSTGNSFYITGSFSTNTEYTFMDQPAVGIKNRITDKIKRKILNTPSGTVLSAHSSIQQKTFTENEYTNNVNLLEVAFSPQNEINDNIISSIGYFNIGDYIGDPRLISSSTTSYPDLDKLRDEYFEKYIHNYDVYDYIRLIKYFDNSFFKMVKDFVPSRTSLASGVVIKQHLLERQKYPTPQAEWTRHEYTGSINSIPDLLEDQRIYSASTEVTSYPIEALTASQAGALPNLVPNTNYTIDQIVNVTQSWDGSRNTPVGQLSFTQDDAQEYVTGEFSGSTLVITDGELNTECDYIKEENTTIITFDIGHNTYNSSGQTLNPATIQLPFSGPAPSFIEGVKITPSGDLDFWWNATRTIENLGAPGKRYTDTFKPEYIAISKTSKNGIDLTNIIPNTKQLTIQTSALNPTITGGGTLSTTTTVLELNILNIQEYPGSYLIQISSDAVITLVNTIPPGDPAPVPYPVVIADQNNIQTLFNPYVNTEFISGDCNPIYGNELEARQSNIFWDLDYSTNAVQAVNQQVVISASQQDGTSTKAYVQDYNWNADRSIIPRYSGSKNTSLDYNIADGAIDATQAYFAYFNWVGGTSPEWGNGLEDRSGVNLRFLIDGEGNIIKPINDSQGINLSILRQNFTEDKISTLAFDDESGASAAFTNLLGDHVVFKSGKSITPICYSQTESIASGSNGGYSTTLEFVQGDQQQSSANDYRLTAYNQGDTIVTTGKVDYPTVQQQNTTYVDWTNTNTYSPTAGNNPGTEGVTLYFNATLKRAGNPVNKIVTVQFYKNGNAVGSPEQFDFNNQFYDNLSINYTDASAGENDDYDLRVIALSGTGILELSIDSYFRVSQQPPPSIGTATANFWEAGSSVNQVATTSTFKNFYGQKQEDIPNSGFFKIVNDFIVQEGDEIRFEGTETQAYYIKRVHTGTTGKIILTLDRDVTASNLQWFLIRRYVDDPANIILEVDKPAGGTSPGILKPQYLSSNVEFNIDNILEKLKTDQLI